MDTHLDPTSIALLNLLTEKQKDYALTLYANREKKASTAYRISFSGSSAAASSALSGGSSTFSASPAW